MTRVARKRPYFARIYLAKKTFLFISIVSIFGCSQSNNSDGGISGTGIQETDSSLETYLKYGLQAGSGSDAVAVLENCMECVEFDEAQDSTSDEVSDTNVQEAGIDEADWIKTDGQYVFSYSIDNDYLYDSIDLVSDTGLAADIASVERRHQIKVFTLDEISGVKEAINTNELGDDLGTVKGLYLHKNEDIKVLTVLSDKHTYSYTENYWHWSESKSQVKILDITSPEENLPELVDIIIDGQFVSSRKIDQTLFVVSQYSAYIDDYYTYPVSDSQQEQNLDLINKTSVESLLPHISINGESEALIGVGDCHIPGKPEDAERPTLAIVTAINLENPTEFTSSCVAATISTVYASHNNVFLVENDSFGIWWGGSSDSTIYQVGIDTGVPVYKAMSDISGTVGWDQPYRLSEYENHLRVLTSKGLDHQLHILALGNDVMSLVSSLPNEQRPNAIGKRGEDIYSVRYQRDRVYIVTFLRTDPFYVLNLADPGQPFIEGELELPGYSTYLHPFNDNLVFGLGRGGTDLRGTWFGSLKMALFDVSDPSNPVVKDDIILGGNYTSTPALYNPRALSFLSREEGTRWQLSLPVSVYDDANQWQQDALYLLDITMDDHANGAGMTLHGALKGAEKDDDLQQGDSLDYARGLFKGDFVHFIYDGNISTQNWLSDVLSLDEN